MLSLDYQIAGGKCCQIPESQSRQHSVDYLRQKRRELLSGQQDSDEQIGPFGEEEPTPPPSPADSGNDEDDDADGDEAEGNGNEGGGAISQSSCSSSQWEPPPFTLEQQRGLASCSSSQRMPPPRLTIEQQRGHRERDSHPDHDDPDDFDILSIQTLLVVDRHQLNYSRQFCRSLRVAYGYVTDGRTREARFHNGHCVNLKKLQPITHVMLDADATDSQMSRCPDCCHFRQWSSGH